MTEIGVLLLGLCIWMGFYEEQWTNWTPAWLLWWGAFLCGDLCVVLGLFNFFKELLT